MEESERVRGREEKYFKARCEGPRKVVNESIVELWLKYISSKFSDVRKVFTETQVALELGQARPCTYPKPMVFVYTKSVPNLVYFFWL